MLPATGTEMKSDGSRLADQIDMNDSKFIEQTNRQTQEIEDEVRSQQELVGSKQSFNHLSNLYDNTTSSEFFQKAKDLADVYSFWRQIRGDGCCFYRALLCARLESILSDKDELTRFMAICKGWRERLIKLGFPQFTTNDFCDWFDELLDDIATNKYDEASLMEALNEEGRSNYYVTFFRLITSGYLRENAATYEGFVEGGRTMEEYCRAEIEPMFIECDHIGIIALTNAIETSIRIEYMDRTAAPDGGWHYEFMVNDKSVQHYFLYRPGHYDIIYKK